MTQIVLGNLEQAAGLFSHAEPKPLTAIDVLGGGRAALERIKNSFNSYPLDRIAIAGAAAAFTDREYFEHTCQLVIDSREQVIGQLQALGFEVLPSAANFIFARHPEHDAAALAAKLREQGVIVRHFKQLRIAQFLRISIGTPEQNAALIEGLSDIE